MIDYKRLVNVDVEHQPHTMDYQGPPPSYGDYKPTPPSGYRVPLRTDDYFPSDRAGPPVAFDLDGSPIFIGSAILDNSVHPCKVAPHLMPACRVAYLEKEQEHDGRYDLLRKFLLFNRPLTIHNLLSYLKWSPLNHIKFLRKIWN